LHERRAKVILEMYTAMQDLIDDVKKFVDTWNSDTTNFKEKYDHIKEASRSLALFFRRNKLFIPLATANILNLECIDQEILLAVSYRTLAEIGSKQVIGPVEAEKLKADALQQLQRFENSLNELEDEFRKLLGDHSIATTVSDP
jgi:hypothetical protein